MDLTAVITPSADNPAHCVLNGSAAVIVNGKFAQFGGRMMVQVSEMILGQFVENFRQAALALPAPAGASAPAEVPSGPAQAADAAATAGASAPATPPRVAGEINGLAIVWALIKGWFSGLFGKRA
jgi:hypothetical protein